MTFNPGARGLDYKIDDTRRGSALVPQIVPKVADKCTSSRLFSEELSKYRAR